MDQIALAAGKKFCPAAFSRLPTFAAKLLAAETVQRIITGSGILLFAGMLFVRVSQISRFQLKAVWLEEVALYALFVLAYALRTRPVHRAIGWWRMLVPPLAAVLPFALLLTPVSPGLITHTCELHAVLWTMALGTALTAWSVAAARKAFSILVECRVLCRGGPYRCFRHPMYLGEILTALAVCVWRPSPSNAIVFSVFVLLQCVRARWEETELLEFLPGYEEFARSALWFWPISARSGQRSSRSIDPALGT